MGKCLLIEVTFLNDFYPKPIFIKHIKANFLNPQLLRKIVKKLPNQKENNQNPFLKKADKFAGFPKKPRASNVQHFLK